MRIRSLIAGAAAVALTLSLVACGDDDGDDAADTGTTEESTTTEAESEDTTAETTEAEEPGSDTTEPETSEPEGSEPEAGSVDLESLLVTQADLGGGFVDQGYEDTDDEGPCGTSIDAANPYDDIAGTVLVDEALRLFFQHEIRTYADDATAADTLAAAEEALSCGSDTVEEGVELGETYDVVDETGGDAAFALFGSLEPEGLAQVLVAVQVGSVISVYQFGGPLDGDDDDSLPDPMELVAANVEAIEAAVG